MAKATMNFYQKLFLGGTIVVLGTGLWAASRNGENENSAHQAEVREVRSGKKLKVTRRSASQRVEKESELSQRALLASLTMSQERVRQMADEKKKQESKQGVTAKEAPVKEVAKASERAQNLAGKAIVGSSVPKQETSEEISKRLLAQAVRAALSAPQPWKELTDISKVQWDLGDESGAKKTLAAALRLAPNPTDESQSGEGLVSISNAQIQMGALDDALSTAYTIKSSYYQNLAMKNVIEAYAKHGEFAEAKVLVSSLSEEALREQAIASIAVNQAKLADGGTSVATVGLISDLAKKNDALRRVAIAQGQRGHWEQAFGTINLINDFSKNQEALRNLLYEKIKLGQVSGARQEIWRIRDDWTRDWLYGQMITKLVKSKQIASAADLLMLIDNQSIQDESRYRISLIEGELGNVSAGLNRVSEIQNLYWKAEGLKGLALVEAREHGAGAGRNVLLGVSECELRDKALGELVKFESSNGRLLEAQNCLMVIAQQQNRIKAKLEIILGAIRNHQYRQAQHQLDEVLPQIENNNLSEADNNFIRLQLARAWVQLNRTQEALVQLDKTEDSYQKDLGLVQLSLDKARQKDVVTAQQLAKRISLETRKESTMVQIAQIFANSVAIEEAEAESKQLASELQKSHFFRFVAKRMKTVK